MRISSLEYSAIAVINFINFIYTLILINYTGAGKI